MTKITFQDGKPVLRDGKVGVGQGCCCGGCGRCVVDGQWNTDYRTKAECERCGLCVESLSTECDGDCPPGTVAKPPLVTLEFSSTKCGTGGTGSVEIGCGTILSATVTDGGSGYATETIAEPTLTLTAPGGTGGVLTVSGYSKYTDSDNAGYWGIAGVTVTSGGSGYTDNAQVSVTLGTGDEARPNRVEPDIRIRTAFRAPNDDWTLQAGSPAPTGTGLVVSLTLTLQPSTTRTYWVDSWAITNGGAGYAVGQRIRPLANEGNNHPFPLRANLEIKAVNSSGAVTTLDLVGTTTSTRNTSRGRYAIDTGVIDSVEFANGPFGTPPSHGAYRKRTMEACPVDVTIIQDTPSVGTGATIAATVETAAGANFGKVKSLTVTNGGSGYAALCERKTTVATCDECPSRESPESSTCEGTGGCPCGTWVVDDNQGPCGCCKWEVEDVYYGVDLYDSELSQQRCNEIQTKLSNLAAAFQSAGWTATVGGSRPGVGDCGRSFYAVCEGCEKAYPKSFTPSGASGGVFSGEPWDRGPCDLDQWVSVPLADVDLAVYAGLPLPSPWCNPQSGGPFPGPPGSQFASVLSNYVVGGMIYIPKCGQRITECSCCKLIAAGQVLDEVDRSCCAECPEGYACYPGACNPLP